MRRDSSAPDAPSAKLRVSSNVDGTQLQPETDARKENRMLFWFSVCLSAAANAAPSRPTAGEIAAGIERRIDTYRNLKFEYSVNARFWPAPSIQLDQDGKPVGDPGSPKGNLRQIQSRDVFKILTSHRDDMSRPWRSWERFVPAAANEWILDRFVAYSAGETATFQREQPDEGRYSDGVIVPNEDWTAYDENIFDRFLCTNLNGVQQYFDPNWALSSKLDRQWEVAQELEAMGRAVYVLRGYNVRQDIDYEVHVTGDPDYVTIRRMARLRKKPMSEPVVLMEVTSIQQVDGIIYPSAGRYIEPGSGFAPRIEYEFTVTSVESLSDAARDEWRPAWPAGTGVMDRVNNKNFTIPHDERVLREIQLQRAKQVPAPEGGMSTGRWTVLFLNASVIVVIAIILLWRRLHRGSRPS
jgi:hypothetical protein